MDTKKKTSRGPQGSRLHCQGFPMGAVRHGNTYFVDEGLRRQKLGNLERQGGEKQRTQ